MTEISNNKQISLGRKGPSFRFGHWILELEICLEFGAWNLEFFNFRNDVPVTLVSNS